MLFQEAFLRCLFVEEFLEASHNLLEDKIFRIDSFYLCEIVLGCFYLDDTALMREGVS